MEKQITRTCENILGIFNACALLCFVEVDTQQKRRKRKWVENLKLKIEPQLIRSENLDVNLKKIGEGNGKLQAIKNGAFAGTGGGERRWVISVALKPIRDLRL